MTKKQLGIICTLMGLIVCVALLGAKLNKGGLNDPSDLSTSLLTGDSTSNASNTNDSEGESKTDDTETLNQTDFFYEARSEREQKQATTIQSLKAIAENQSTNEEQKTNATNELQKLTLRRDKQQTIELDIRNKGFEDALCEISDDDTKASIIVKAVAGLSEKDGAEIQEIVQNASGIKEVTIEAKK